MKFLKKSQLNFRNVKDNSVAIQITGEITLDSVNSLRLPNGNTSQRPSDSVLGRIRYNSQTNEVEVYQGSSGKEAWRSLRYKESTQITQQDLGAGDDEEIFFGPLNPAPPQPSLIDDKGSWSGANLIVLVENVFQLYDQNYIIQQNPCKIQSSIINFNAGTKTITSENPVAVNFLTAGFRQGQTITITNSISNNGIYTIQSVTASNIVTDQPLLNEPSGTSLEIQGHSSATGPLAGVIYPTGYYIKFDSPVPIGTIDPKKVIVLHGFDK